jgi:hypothetical protein
MSRKGNPYDNAACESFMKRSNTRRFTATNTVNFHEVHAIMSEFLEAPSVDLAEVMTLARSLPLLKRINWKRISNLGFARAASTEAPRLAGQLSHSRVHFTLPLPLPLRLPLHLHRDFTRGIWKDLSYSRLENRIISDGRGRL